MSWPRVHHASVIRNRTPSLSTISQSSVVAAPSSAPDLGQIAANLGCLPKVAFPMFDGNNPRLGVRSTFPCIMLMNLSGSAWRRCTLRDLLPVGTNLSPPITECFLRIPFVASYTIASIVIRTSSCFSTVQCSSANHSRCLCH